MTTHGEEEPAEVPGSREPAARDTPAAAAAPTGSAAPTTPTGSAAPYAPPAPEPATAATRRATLLVFLALANILGAALLFFAVAKGQDAVHAYGCPTVHYSTPQPYPSYPGDSVGAVTYTGGYADGLCDKTLAKPLLGLGFAPVLAVMVSGFLTSVLLDRRLRRFAVLQAGFFVLTLGMAVFGINTLVNYWV